MYHLKKIYPAKEGMVRRVKNRRVHMANERTFLAWIRTSIGIIALGFVVEKFILAPIDRTTIPSSPRSLGQDVIGLMGFLLVLLGAVVAALATYRFLRTEKEIIEDTYRPSLAADLIIAFLLVSISVFLAAFLLSGR